MHANIYILEYLNQNCYVYYILKETGNLLAKLYFEYRYDKSLYGSTHNEINHKE